MPGRERPRPTAGLRHVALRVSRFDACLEFYTELMGLAVEWRPDEDTAFLTSGDDNLALHRVSEPPAADGQRLDHIGFVVATRAEVDRRYEELRSRGAAVSDPPRDHRDGARSFMCRDPDGTEIQVIHHPSLAEG